MAKAIQPFYWDGVFYDPDDDEKSEVPDEVAAKVSASLVDSQPEVDVSAFDGEAFDLAVEAKVAVREQELAQEHQDAVKAAVDEALTAQREREAEAYETYVASVAAGDGFDPTKVKAVDVKAYLEGIDRDTAAGAAEYAYVVKAEQDGENRTTAFPADSSDD